MFESTLKLLSVLSIYLVMKYVLQPLDYKNAKRLYRFFDKDKVITDKTAAYAVVEDNGVHSVVTLKIQDAIQSDYNAGYMYGLSQYFKGLEFDDLILNQNSPDYIDGVKQAYKDLVNTNEDYIGAEEPTREQKEPSEDLEQEEGSGEEEPEEEEPEEEEPDETADSVIDFVITKTKIPDKVTLQDIPMIGIEPYYITMYDSTRKLLDAVRNSSKLEYKIGKFNDKFILVEGKY